MRHKNKFAMLRSFLKNRAPSYMDAQLEKIRSTDEKQFIEEGDALMTEADQLLLDMIKRLH